MLNDDLEISINNSNYDLFIYSTINMLISDICSVRIIKTLLLNDLLHDLKVLRQRINYKAINSKNITWWRT